MCVCVFFLTKQEPRNGHGNFTTEVCFLKQSGKFPVAIPRFLLLKNKNTVIRFAVVLSFLWCFIHSLFLIGNFVMVDSQRFPESSGIDPKKALVINSKAKSETCHVWILLSRSVIR